MDRVIYHRVMSILAEMGLHSPISLIEDFDPQHCCKNIGPFRLYEFAILVRDDMRRDKFVKDFGEQLKAYNAVSNIKIDFYDLTEYSGTLKNYSMLYLTVTTI